MKASIIGNTCITAAKNVGISVQTIIQKLVETEMKDGINLLKKKFRHSWLTSEL